MRALPGTEPAEQTIALAEEGAPGFLSSRPLRIAGHRLGSASKCEQEGVFGHFLGAILNEDSQVRGGARGESRTPTPFRAPDPKSGASAVPPLSRWLNR